MATLRMSARFLTLAALLSSALAVAQVPFVAETTPIPTNSAGDLAIVVDHSTPFSPPLIVAGDPIQNGLYVYGPNGGLRQIVPYGAIRGLDSRTDLGFPAGTTILSAAAGIMQQAVFATPTLGMGVVDVTSRPVNVPTAAALAMRRLADAGAEVVVDDSAGVLRHFVLVDDTNSHIDVVSRPNITLPGVPSAMVFDDRTGILYVAIPTQGLFRVSPELGVVEALAPLDGGQFGGLVSGLAFYPLSDGGGLLLTTVPTLDEVTVHALNGVSEAVYLTRFTVAVGSRVVRYPLYCDVVPNRLPGFDAGLFVIQDNTSANYKLVPWELLATSTPIELPVEVPEDFLDAGAPDAGDGGSADGGVTDGGTGGGGGSGDGGTRGGGRDGGTAGGTSGPPPKPLEKSGCGCTEVDTLIFPALWGLWFITRSRRRRTEDA
jgi:myo-inositol-hexaphosphate 3-phosphohydrolase